MQKRLLFIVYLIISSCGVKTTRELVANGDYDSAINKAISNLRSNKNSKGNQDYVYLLEEAFAKAKERDFNNLKFLIKDKNPSNLEKIYNTYLNLENRQDKIRGLLPLRLIKENRDAQFPFDDYSNDIIASKNDLSEYLYSNSIKLMATKNKMSYRQAFDDFLYLEKINPGYKNISNFMDECKFKGTDFVFVSTKNATDMVIPKRLQDDLLNIGTYDLNDKWTVYHSVKENKLKYDFNMLINFRSILISPERINERQFTSEKEVVTGQKAKLDANGNTIKGSDGKPIMEDIRAKVTATIFEFKQFKDVKVDAMVEYRDARNELVRDALPLSSTFVFEYIYANYNGDRRACESNYLGYFDRRSVPFPTNEQMVFDCGEDLKAKLKAIITRNRFRN